MNCYGSIRAMLFYHYLTIPPPTAIVPFAYNRMYRGLADAVLFGGGTDGGAVFYQVKSQLLGSLFQVLFHASTP